MFKGERYEKSGESLTRRGKIVDEPGGVGGAVKSRGNISKNACKWGKDVGKACSKYTFLMPYQAH